MFTKLKLMFVVINVILILVGGAIAQKNPSSPPIQDSVFNDTCEYWLGLNPETGKRNAVERYRCGDHCIGSSPYCFCGGETFQVSRETNHCCVTSGQNCTSRPGVYGDDIVCDQGSKIPMTEHCPNDDRRVQCHNSYQDSLYIGRYSHYTCPHTCVSVLHEMCRGIDWCGTDVQECGPHLICHEFDVARKLSLKSNLTSEHHYCFPLATKNDGEFNTIDRSDEESALISEGTSYDIDHEQFNKCYNRQGLLGLTCNSYCLYNSFWCDNNKWYG